MDEEGWVVGREDMMKEKEVRTRNGRSTVKPGYQCHAYSSALFIVQNWPGMEWIELSRSKIAWIIVLESPNNCSI